MNYLIQKWKLTRCVNLYHWFVIGIIFSYVKKIFGSIVNLQYEDTLFILFFHLEGNVSIKTALKFQQYYHIVNKVTYLLPKLSTVEKLITFNNFQYRKLRLTKLCFVLIWCFCWKEMLDTELRSWIYFLTWYPVALTHRWALFCVIRCRIFRLLLINIYVKFESSISSFGKEIALKRCHI